MPGVGSFLLKRLPNARARRSPRPDLFRRRGQNRRKVAESRGKSRRACRPNPKCVPLVAEFRLLVMPGWRICMQDLRLVGVHDDGEHLLLSGTGGEMFQLPIDEALRVAASRTSAKTASSAAAPLLPCLRATSRPGSATGPPPPKWRSCPEFRWRKSSAMRARSWPNASTSPSRPARWRSPPPPRATTSTGPCSVTTRPPSATWSSTGSGPTASSPQPWSGIPGDVPTAAGTWWPASSPSPAARPGSARSRRPCGPSTPPGSPCRTPTAGPSS